MNIALFHSNYKSPWIAVDKAILSSVADIREVHVANWKQTLASLSDVRESEIVIFWFASFRFYPLWLMAKFYRKKTVIIAGGYDVSDLPSLKYGAFQGNFISRFLRLLMFYFTDQVIGVSKSNLGEIKQNLILKTSPTFIYLGFMTESLPPLKPYLERPLRVVMIANIPDEQSFFLKGFNIFLEIAKRFPYLEFIHVGEIGPINVKAPENVKLMGQMNYSSPEFSEILNSSRIIFQHSAIESFCAAVVDGALMGCLPLVSDRFSLPEIVGNDGLIARYGDLDQVEELLRQNLEKPISSELIRAKFSKKFSFQKRQDELLKLIFSLS